MNCLWEDIPSTTDHRGWRKVRCTRPMCKWTKGISYTPNEFKDIYAECAGWPRWHELGNWVEIVLLAVGVSQRRVSAIIRRPCPCPEGKAALNSLGERAKAAILALFAKIGKLTQKR